MNRHLSLFLLFSFCVIASTHAAERPNVLLILVDDLKPTLGCYGDSVAKTPHIDQLAKRGTRFELAYCNQAVCAPSRFTLMLGSHSTSTGLYSLGSQLRHRIPDAVTMPQYFAKHGYRTESLGKVFHIGHGNEGDPESFAVPHFKEKVIEYVDPASTPGGQLTREEAMFRNVKAPPGGMNSLPRGAAFESPDVADDAYADGRVAAETVRRLQAAKGREQPFFIVAGFARPHLPFSAPKKYWDLYDPADFEFATNPELPANSPPVAHKRGGEIRNYFPVPDKQDPAEIDESIARKLIHGYYASTSFVDAQIGKVIDELDRLNLADNTIIVLWGDHGFHLGDHGIWTKHTNYEQANRIPLMITAPGVTKPNSSTKQLVESVDIMSTLAELAGLPAPSGPQPVDGRSLVAVLRDPAARVRDHAYHVFPKGKLGRAIRTERYRLVAWQNVGDAPDTAELELYDYETDPHETRNLAATEPDLVRKLRAILATYPEPVDPNAGARRASAGVKHPNIVMVFIDDMGWGDFSCFGNEDATTTNIDRVAAEGIRFEQFYVNSPICSPSRCALTTGQYPQRWRITSFLNNREDNKRRGVAQWLDPTAPTLARILKENGYATGHFGKWHLGGQRDVDDAPPISTYGFDETLTNFEGMGAKLLPMTRKPGEAQLGRIWEDAERLGSPVIWMQRSEITGGFVSAAIPFIDRATAAGKPFFINLWPDDVHSPFWPPVETWGDGSKRRLYLSVLEEMDRQIGRLFDHIRDTPALRDNTLVLVCSDNGPDVGAGSAGPFRGTKATLYEGGTRSPLVVWGPGLIAKEHKGMKNDSSVFAAFDLAPSLLSIAGIASPENVKFDGENLMSTLLGRSTASRTAPLFWRRPPDRKMAYGAGPLPDLSVREGNWKLLCEFDGTKPELYDLTTDPGETQNLALQESDVVERLTRAALAWNETMPQDNGPKLTDAPSDAGHKKKQLSGME